MTELSWTWGKQQEVGLNRWQESSLYWWEEQGASRAQDERGKYLYLQGAAAEY